MKNCDVTRDLLPLCIDNSCSEDSRKFVDAHIAECSACRAMRDAASKTVQTMLTGKKVKKSFHQFRRKTILKKTLLILLCVLIALIPLSILAYDTYSNYQFNLYWPHPARIKPIASTVSRLSDGSIYLTLQYTGSDVYVNNYSTSLGHLLNPFTDDDVYFEDNGTYYIQPGYSLIDQTDPRRKNSINPRYTFLISTSESYPKYEQPRGSHEGFDQPYKRIILIGSDGERVLWQEGDELPAADIQAEAELARRIDGTWIVPVDPSEK